jgi:hypothetical protein
MRTCLILTCVLATLVFAQAPRFLGPETLYSSGAPIQVSYYGSPVMSDWNGDGNKDLICGEFNGGYVRFYANTGLDSSPVFNGFEYLQASGSQITMPYG